MFASHHTNSEITTAMKPGATILAVFTPWGERERERERERWREGGRVRERTSRLHSLSPTHIYMYI